MERVTFIESIIKILNLIASVPFFIEILLLTLILTIMMIFFYFRKSKKGKITSLIIYIVTLFLLPISHLSFFANTIDKIVENYIEILYFPSCYVYIALLIITDVSIFRRILKNIKGQEIKWYSLLYLVYFFVFQFLFFLIVRVVMTENINIFERSQLYTNVTLTSLLQVSSYLFWIRFGIGGIAFIVNRLSNEGLSINKIEQTVTRKVVVPIEKNDNSVNHNLMQSGFEPNNFLTSNSSTIDNHINKKSLSSLDDFSINQLSQQNNTYKNNLNSGNNNMDITTFITNVDNNKNKPIKLTDNDLIRPSITPSIQDIQPEQLNKSVENIKRKDIKTTNIDLDLNNQEETEKFFDDFY